MRYLQQLMVALLVLTGVSAHAAPPAPQHAAGVGYTRNTFSSEFVNDIDLKDSRTSSHNWYVGKWFGWPSTSPRALGVKKGEGITLYDGGNTANYTIGSAAENMKKKPLNWVGKAFGGGGYFEAVIKFDTAGVRQKNTVGFPAWWMEPIEHLANPRTGFWPGQPANYEHFVEVDVFEYNQWQQHGPNAYSAAVHDWFGIYNKTCAEQFCHAANYGGTSNFDNHIVETPIGTDFNQFHKFGVLWVPATDKTQGYLHYYFDGKPTATRVSWDKFKGQMPPAGKAPWTFGVLDQQHLVLILGTGNNQPMTIKSVNVWQANTKGNLQN